MVYGNTWKFYRLSLALQFLELKNAWNQVPRPLPFSCVVLGKLLPIRRGYLMCEMGIMTLSWQHMGLTGL